MKEENGEELILLIDTRTRWSSLFAMVERFLRVKTSILKSSLDIPDFPETFKPSEWRLLQDLKDTLEPIKLGIEALSKDDATLLSAEGIFRFIFQKLEENPSDLAGELLRGVKEVTRKRKVTKAASLLKYLNNPNAEEIPSRSSLETTAWYLWMRLFGRDPGSTSAAASTTALSREQEEGPQNLLQELSATIKQVKKYLMLCANDPCLKPYFPGHPGSGANFASGEWTAGGDATF